MSAKYVDVRITALCEEDLNDLLIALRKIQWCGEVGAGRTLPIHIDGDGSGRFGFGVFDGGEIKDIKNLREMVNLDEKKLEKVRNGEDFETQWVGE